MKFHSLLLCLALALLAYTTVVDAVEDIGAVSSESVEATSLLELELERHGRHRRKHHKVRKQEEEDVAEEGGDDQPEEATAEHGADGEAADEEPAPRRHRGRGKKHPRNDDEEAEGDEEEEPKKAHRHHRRGDHHHHRNHKGGHRHHKKEKKEDGVEGLETDADTVLYSEAGNPEKYNDENQEIISNKELYADNADRPANDVTMEGEEAGQPLPFHREVPMQRKPSVRQFKVVRGQM